VRKAITIGIVAVMVLMGFVAMANPIVATPSGTIVKSMSDNNFWLGDKSTITLDVTIAGGPLTVLDPLPEYLSYMPGTFVLIGGEGKPKIDHDGVSIKLDPGTYTIMFDVIFDSAPAEGFMDYNTAYLMDGKCVVGQCEKRIWVNQYCGFHKGPYGPEGGPHIVPINTDYHWDFEISVSNHKLDFTMYDVQIWDRFGAEIEGHGDPDTGGVGSTKITLKGRSEKIFLHWKVGDLVEPGEPGISSATLTWDISTDENPKGWQEYTSPTPCGDPPYEMNSGAVLKFKMNNEEGIQLSAVTPSIYVIAV
jgi:hypothetical protein